MRSLVLGALVALTGCGPEFAVVPDGGQPRAVSAVGPVTMTALAVQWEGSPFDLADYVTPIAVELYNAGPSEVSVSYADFALRDERGFRFGAINPFLPAVVSALPQKPVLLAARGGGGFGGGGRGGSGGRGGVTVGPPTVGRGLGPGAGQWGGWNGYQISGGLRGYYWPGTPFWQGPLYYPPYYSEWVYFWGPNYYPARPSADVLTLGLPEGVLAPGGRVNGFLYFQRATAASRRLTLAWEARDARTNAFLSTAQVQLDVIHN
jgi:hypothetical protein